MAKPIGHPYEQGITGENLNKQADTDKQRSVANRHRTLAYPLYHRANRKRGKISHEHEKAKAYRNEIKSYIVRAGMTMTEVVDYLSDEYGWSASVPNLSGKLRRGSLRYGEAVELADALGYDIIWKKRER